MRMKELQRYLDKLLDRDAIGDRIEALQAGLTALRDNLPEAPVSRVRDALPSYRDVRRKLPFAPAERRGYAVPATLAIGGIAILGAIVVTALVMSDTRKRTPPRNEDNIV
jgi:uncharacterized protein YegL